MARTLSAQIEAILFTAGGPVSRKIIEKRLQVAKENIDDALNALKISLEGRGLALLEEGDMIELRSSPAVFDALQSFSTQEFQDEIGKASLETLAIILYAGSITKGDVEYIRGVNSQTALRTLLLRGLIERKEGLDKRKSEYQATTEALAHLGVSSSHALPHYEEFRNALIRVRDVQSKEPHTQKEEELWTT